MSNPLTTINLDVKELLLEQVMRISSDIVLAAKIDKSKLGSKTMKANIGRLLSAHPDAIIPGSPLAVLLEIDQYDANWRRKCPKIKNSLWAKVEFAKKILPPQKIQGLALLEVYYLLSVEE